MTDTACIAIIKIESTSNWDKKIQKKIGKIYDVFWCDLNSRTYCSEITPSYELNFIGYTWTRPIKNETEQERIYDLMADVEAATERVCYMHQRIIDALPERSDVYFVGEGYCVIEIDDDAKNADEIDDYIRETYVCNGLLG